MTEEQRIFMAVGKALVKTVRERFPVSSNIKSLWENSGQIGSPYSYYIVQLIRAKRKNSILKNVISSAKRSLKFGERDALCDELCYLVFSLLYMSDIFLPQNSFVTFFHVEGSHVFLVLHTDLGVKSFSSPFGQYDVEFEAGFKQIKEFFEKRNAVIIDPWISCVVPVEDWLSLGKQAEEYKVMNFFKGQYNGWWSESLENRNSSELYKSLNKETSVFIPLKNRFVDYYEKIKEKDISIYGRTLAKKP